MRSFISKATIAALTIRNLHTFLLDRAGLIRHRDLTYRTRKGLKFTARAGTNDHAEVAVVCSGREYPARYFPTTCKPTVLDVGAHIGSFSVFAAQLLREKDPMIYAVEPSIANFVYLERNTNRYSEVICRRLAIGGTTGTTYLDLTKDYDGFSAHSTKPAGPFEMCEVFTLEDFCTTEGIEYIDLLKVDSEGSEYALFENSLDFIRETVGTAFVEAHWINGKQNPAAFEAFVTANGFVVLERIHDVFVLRPSPIHSTNAHSEDRR